MIKVLVAGTIVAALAANAVAQDSPHAYPQRPVRVIVPFPAGGLADALPRIISEKLSAMWGQPVTIENRPGAGGSVGTSSFSRLEPDGYTLLATPAGPLVTNSVVQTLNYDPLALAPISLLATAPVVLIVRKDFPANTPSEFVAFAKANPGRLNYATQGPGSNAHLSAAMLENNTGIKMVPVPYPGSAPALNDMMGGIIDLMFDNLGSSLPLHDSGKLKIIAAPAEKRIDVLPNVPTFLEEGFTGVVSATWFALLAPPKTDAAVRERISESVKQILDMDDVREKLQRLGVEPRGTGPGALGELIRTDKDRWAKIAAVAGIRPQVP